MHSHYLTYKIKMNKDTFLKIWFEWSPLLTLNLPHELNRQSGKREEWYLEVEEVKMAKEAVTAGGRLQSSSEQPGGETVESTVREEKGVGYMEKVGKA